MNTIEGAIGQILQNLSAYPEKSIPFIKTILEHRIIILDYQLGTTHHEVRNSYLYECRERCFIRGFMKHSDAHRFIAWINSNTDKIAYCVHNNSTTAFEQEYYEGDMTKTQGIVVSMEGLHIRGCIEYIPFVKVPIALPSSIVDADKIRAFLHPTVELDMIVCIDPVYGRIATNINGLYTTILTSIKALEIK